MQNVDAIKTNNETVESTPADPVSLHRWLCCTQKPYYEDESVVLYHADNRDVLPKIPEETIDSIIADPPYGISYRSNHRQNKFEFITNDKEYPVEWLKELKRITKSSSSLYLFCNDASLDVARLSLFEVGYELKKTLIWDKLTMAGGDLENYGDRCEFILFANKYYKPKLNGSRDGNVIQIPRIHPPALRHPTEKPELLISYLIMKSTDYGEIILDPYCGSGVSLVSAKRLRRRAIGVEIEERYCEIAAKRLLQNEMQFE